MDTFVGDTIRINLNTGIDISGYSTLCIKYKKPDGTTGAWPATIDPSNSNKMYYDCETEDIDQSGEWAIQASVEEGAQQLNSRWVRFDVYNPIKEACATTLAPTTLAPTTAP